MVITGAKSGEAFSVIAELTHKAFSAAWQSLVVYCSAIFKGVDTGTSSAWDVSLRAESQRTHKEERDE